MYVLQKPAIGLLLAIFVAGCGRSTPVESTQSEDPVEAAESSAAATTDANTVLTSALAEAASADKNVLVHLGAPW